MSATTTDQAGTGGALLTHLREPMRRASYALILGTGLTSALGLLFWALAAHWLSPAEVGIGAALVSAAGLLANIATLGLRNGLVRFLPEAGGAARRLILRAFAVCAAAAVGVAAVFVAGQPVWADQLGLLRDSPLAAVGFCLATAVWVLYILQDHVLTGLHRASWVPVSNGLSSLAKIGLLAVLPLLWTGTGWTIFAATTLASAATVLAVTVLILRATPPATGTPAVGLRRLVRFAATDHLASLLWLATGSVLTLLVLQELGPAASAYYYLANTIAYALFLVTSNVSSALVAESARSPERALALIRAALRNASLLVLPAALLGMLLAEPVLRLFGAAYAEQATPLLRLLLLSAVPQVVVGVALAAARLRQDLGTIALTYGVQAALTYAGTWLAIERWGLTGIGIACLASQALVAVLLLASGRSGIWTPATTLRAAVGGWRRRLRQRELAARLAPALAAAGLPSDTPHRLLTSDSDALVVALDPPVGPLVLKIATSPAATAGLDRQADRLAALVPAVGDDPVARLLPRVLTRATLAGERVLVETRRPGTAAGPNTTPAALAAITALHRTTATTVLVEEPLLRSWVDEPLDQLRRLPARVADPAVLDALAADLRAALAGQQVTAAAVHGDFWPGNVLVSEGAVTGIVDWEDARPVGLPDIDLAHWWLATQPAELGHAVRRALADPAAAEATLGALPVARPNPQLPVRTVVLLAWLGHVRGGLARASRHPLSPLWVRRNVRPVLDHVATASGRAR